MNCSNMGGEVYFPNNARHKLQFALACLKYTLFQSYHIYFAYSFQTLFSNNYKMNRFTQMSQTKDCKVRKKKHLQAVQL